MMWNQNDIVRGELKNISFDIKADVSPDKEEHFIVLTKLLEQILLARKVQLPDFAPTVNHCINSGFTSGESRACVTTCYGKVAVSYRSESHWVLQ